jgi:predicted HAD superfamily Cof-like phosphohydrolase
MTFTDQVRELHEAFGMEVNAPLTAQRLIRYAERLQEEMDEARDAWTLLHVSLVSQHDDATIRSRSVELLKELMDVHYMASVISMVFGWDEEEAFRRVHQSNMAKLWEDGKPRFRGDGKILKPPTYRTPELEDLV